jgi:hypothetical protein
MKCEFKNCKQEGFSVSIICYSEQGDFETVLLCKRHTLMLVPRQVRDFYAKDKMLLSRINIQQEIDRTESLLSSLKDMLTKKDKGEN